MMEGLDGLVSPDPGPPRALAARGAEEPRRARRDERFRARPADSVPAPASSPVEPEGAGGHRGDWSRPDRHGPRPRPVAVRSRSQVRGERHFVDTGAWFAYVNVADPDHQRVRLILDAPPGRLVTSSYVFDETVTLTQARLGHRRAVTIGRTLLDLAVVELLSIAPADERAAWSLFEKRPDKSYSFTDCTSFVLMRRERIGTAVALDQHFTQEGFVVVPAGS